MAIVPPAHGPWRDPSDGRPFVSLTRTRDGRYEVTVRPGADPVDLARVLDTIPPDAVFVEAFGDVTTIMVFRTIPAVGVPAGPADDGDVDPLAALIPDEPIDGEPHGCRPRSERRRILAHSLAGVRLGEHDRRILAWLTVQETSMIVTLASLTRRARLAERTALIPAE